LRIASPALSPVVWLPLLVLAATRQGFLALIFLVLVVAVQGLSVAGDQLRRHMPTLNPLRLIPPFPGCVGNMIRHNIGQILSVLDFYLPQHRWRFTGGDIRFSVLQIVLGSGLAIEEYRHGAWFLAMAFGAYAVSLYAGALYWDTRLAANQPGKSLATLPQS
jgi:hypothetical protein